MVMYRRNRIPGGSYFFTVNLADRRSSLLVDNIDSLRMAFREVHHERPFAIDAIVILPEHIHTIFTLPEHDSDFPGRWQAIKSRFCRHLAAAGAIGKYQRGRAYNLWQPRYWEHTIRNMDDFRAHTDYIHFNPVKHGWVKRVRDWPFSSFHRCVRQGILPEDWGDEVSIPSGGFGE